MKQTQKKRRVSNDTWGALTELHSTITQKYKVVGSSMAIMKDVKLTLEHHTGYADKATKRKTDSNTIYHWASVTKTFTGIAIMQLRDQKKLKLSDPIVNYVPELKKMNNPYGKIEDITIWHLLTHSAGFRDNTWPHQEYKAGDWQELMSRRKGFRILFKPGSKHSYSNLGINFLAPVIEQLSGLRYEKYIQKNIFDPLGMTHSYFNITPKNLLKYRSNNYSIDDGKLITNGLDFTTGVTTANGGLNAPCTDMVKYMDFLCNGHTILKRSSLEEMWQPLFLVEKTADLTEKIGIAFFVINRKKHIFIGHEGSQYGFRCFMYIDPKNKSGVVVNLNTAGEHGRPYTRKGLHEARKAVLDFIALKHEKS